MPFCPSKATPDLNAETFWKVSKPVEHACAVEFHRCAQSSHLNVWKCRELLKRSNDCVSL